MIGKEISSKEKKEVVDVKKPAEDMLDKTKEYFVLKTKLTKEATKKCIEIHDFILKIEGQDKKLKISTPKFELAGKEFSLEIYPDYKDSGYIGVYLQNDNTEDQMTSITIKEASGGGATWEMDIVLAGQDWGCPKFQTQKKYRKWAKDHGDVLRLEVLLTLHIKAEGEGWTR